MMYLNRYYHSLKKHFWCSKRYIKAFIIALLFVTSVFILKYHTNEKKESIINFNHSYQHSEEDQKKSDDKDLLSFNDILGKPANPSLNVKKPDHDKVIEMIAAANLRENTKLRMKKCFEYFDSLPDDLLSSISSLNYAFGIENTEFHLKLASIVRKYEFCKDLDYNTYTIDESNKDMPKKINDNSKDEMYRYKIIWNYILNNYIDENFESKIFFFLKKDFLNKSAIEKYTLNDDGKFDYTRNVVKKAFNRLTPLENLQYMIKGDNYLYETIFKNKDESTLELSYMGEYLSYDVKVSELFNNDHLLINDFRDNFQLMQESQMLSEYISSLNKRSQFEENGIILTMGSRHINILPKYLSALKKHFVEGSRPTNSNYHVQIVFNDIDEEFNRHLQTKNSKEEILNNILKPKLMDFKDYFEISVLEVGDILNCSSDNIESFKFFMNKWIALNFNEFNRFIFTDIDVALFTHPDELFTPKYGISKLYEVEDNIMELFSKYKTPSKEKTHPLVLFPDRFLKERTFTQCTNLFKDMLATTKERYDFNDFKTLSIPTLQQLSSINSNVASVFNNIFDQDVRKLHNIDSSLIIVNNYNDISTNLMFSAMLNFIGLDRCVYGDKEFLALGMIYLGRFDFDVLGVNTGLVTSKKKIDNVACVTQSAQIVNGKLISINGGLRKCKIDPVSYAVGKDLEDEAKANWLAAYYQLSNTNNLEETLNEDYIKPIDIEVLVEPNAQFEFELKKDYNDIETENNYWMNSAFCMEYGYCLNLEKEGIDDKYNVIVLDDETIKHYEGILEAWNSA
ncbi:hypothetical protein ACO0R3_000116 [Hanseniaspora guilliermondii]